MAKLKDEAIGLKDFREYLASASDFAFELQVLKMLRELGLECQHGGTYEDAQTSKLRQFDIRASTKLGYANLFMAVECKQVRAYFPLLVLRVPRRREESFHHILLSIDPNRFRLEEIPTLGMPPGLGAPLRVKTSTLYNANEPVGKSCAQVGRDNNIGVTGTDSDVFAKWSQALCSAQGVINDAFWKVPTVREGWWVSIVLPVVVVPDERLWVVDFDEDGNMVDEPRKVHRCAYYISTECFAGDKLRGVTYIFSHLEFVTISGLRDFVSQFGSKRDGPDELVFPLHLVKKLLNYPVDSS